MWSLRAFTFKISRFDPSGFGLRKIGDMNSPSDVEHLLIALLINNKLICSEVSVLSSDDQAGYEFPLPKSFRLDDRFIKRYLETFNPSQNPGVRINRPPFSREKLWSACYNTYGNF